MNKFKIYTAHSITGLSGKEVINYFEDLKTVLSNMGYHVLHPMVAKGGLRNEISIKATQNDKIPIATNHAIKSRDYWMIRQADIVLSDLCDTKNISIGCTSEIAVANILGKHIIGVIEPGNIHEHAFILEGIDVRVYTLEEAKRYLNKLINNLT